jgi:hypothetical protein
MQNIELAYLAVAYGMAGIMFYATRHKTFSTVSHIALDQKLTRRVFFWGLVISALLFALLMYKWAIPHFSLGLIVQVLVGFILICQVCTGFFPINEKGLKGAHTIFASSLGIGMFLLVVTLAFSIILSPLARAINGLLALGMVMLLFTSIRVPRGEYLLHEKVFFAFWHLAIFCSIYFG